jgi:CBS domain containing-hemolysin-like protein
MKNLAEKGNKRAEKALALAEDYDSLISTVLIGNNIVNTLAASLGTLFFAGLLTAENQDLAATLSTISLTVVVLIFGEISPKTMAKNAPDKFVLFSAPIIGALKVVFTPFNYVFKHWQDLLGRLFKKSEEQTMTEEELISIIEEAEEEGGLDEEESTLIKSAIEFGDLEVGEIFTPRIDITAVKIDTDKKTLADIFSESGYSRIPVYEEDLDNILGIVYYKDFFSTSNDENTSLKEIIKPVIYVTKSMKVNDLLKDLQEKQLHLAVVTDEYGSTAGIVTLEDVLEEIVGDIWDEHDEIIEEIRSLGNKEYIVSGMANLDKFFEELDIASDESDDEDAATVNGWAMNILGRIPEEGDSFEAEGLTVKVLKMDGRRIDDLHVLDNRTNGEEDDEKDLTDEAEIEN